MLSQGIVSGARSRSHEEREAHARRFAGGLEALGVGQGDCVAILMRNDIAFIEATLGTMMLGAYPVPINWHLKGEEIAYVLTDCGAKLLIGHSDLLHGLGAALPAHFPVLALAPPPEILASYRIDPAHVAPPAGASDLEAWLAAQPAYADPPLPPPQSMIYTSGTTGRPKGVRRLAPTAEQQRATEETRALVYGLKPGIRALLPGPLYHAAPNSFGVRSALIGDVLVLMPRFDAEELLRLIEGERIDTIFMVPTMFIRLLQLPLEVRGRYDLASVRHVIHAAAPCPPDVKAAMIDWFGPIIFEFYGGTETGVITFATSEDSLRKPGTVGKCPPGTDMRILDDAGNILKPGEIGEIFGRCPTYPDFTYHNLPQERAKVERDGFITCGDVGYVDEDGYLFICDRKRDMVISGGVNIYPAEIEAVLQAVPGVKDCAVFGIPDAEFGEALMAVVEPLPGAELDDGTIRRALAGRLAAYKVPKQIELRRELPREDSGKIFKRRLREPYWEQAGRRI